MAGRTVTVMVVVLNPLRDEGAVTVTRWAVGCGLRAGGEEWYYVPTGAHSKCLANGSCFHEFRYGDVHMVPGHRTDPKTRNVPEHVVQDLHARF